MHCGFQNPIFSGSGHLDSNPHKTWQIWCGDGSGNGCGMSTKPYSTKEEAAKRWNQIGNPERVCKVIREWANLMENAERIVSGKEFRQAWQSVNLAISKSCLLDRMLYAGEGISKIPCPVHKGQWSGIHIGWPNEFWIDRQGNKTPVEESVMCRQWYDAGCRCYKHKCGCTTGWNVDKSCGCVK